MIKDGAVRCQHCGSCEVTLTKTASVKVSEGSENLEDDYECQTCNKKFSRTV